MLFGSRGADSMGTDISRSHSPSGAQESSKDAGKFVLLGPLGESEQSGSVGRLCIKVRGVRRFEFEFEPL